MIEGYSNLSLESLGCSPGSLLFRATFKFASDVSSLFPFINAVGQDAVYYDHPHYIQFTLNGFRCALYPDNAFASKFENKEQATKFIKQLIDFLNDLYSKKDSIAPNHNKFKHIPVLDIFKLLPRINCKVCGFPSCMAFAGSLSKGETDLGQCPELVDCKNEKVVKLKAMLFK